jgi:hypothetical protein
MGCYDSAVEETLPRGHVKEVIISWLVVCTLQELLELRLVLGTTFRSNGSVLEAEGCFQL